MKCKQFLLLLLVATIPGVLGGASGTWFLMPQAVLAQDESQNVRVARISSCRCK